MLSQGSRVVVYSVGTETDEADTMRRAVLGMAGQRKKIESGEEDRE